MSKKNDELHNIGDIYLRVGANIRRLRNQFGITIEELANSSGIDASFLGNIERGNRKPTLYTIEKLAKALNVAAPSLLGSGPIKNPAPKQDIVNQNIMRLLNRKSPKERKKIYNLLKHL
jgi:transcriptional regulator with XRE-family HTH domain